jgi:hypothetical protein
MNDSVKNSGITAELVDITPAMARQILDAGDVNWRTAKRPRVRELANELLEGKWELNGESIILDKLGRAIDGGHRLPAVVLAGETNPLIFMAAVLVRGVPLGRDRKIDCGKPRTLPEMMAYYGFKNTAVLSSIVKYAYHYEVRGERRGRITANKLGVSYTHLADYVQDNPTMLLSAAAAQKYHTNLIAGGVVGAVHYLASKAGGSRLADKFLADVTDGADVEMNSGADALRQRLLRDRRAGRLNSTLDKIILTAKAWNYYVDGTPVKNLTVGQRNRAKGGLSIPDIKGA